MMLGRAGWAADRLGKWNRPLALGFTILFAVQFAYWIGIEVRDTYFSSFVGVDRVIYHDAALRVLDGGFWFYPDQVAGQPYEPVRGHVMYPPVALIWFIPAAFLPDILWWAIPITVIVAIAVRHRPSPWGWAVMALCLAWPWSAPIFLAGNPAIWVAAACALGTVWRPSFALVLAKPSLFPFALFGVRSRGWWAICGGGLLVSIAMLPLTLQWIGVIANARGKFSGPLYAIHDVGWLTLPLVAWYTGQRHQRNR